MRRFLAALCAGVLLIAACSDGDSATASTTNRDLPMTTEGPPATATAEAETTAPPSTTTMAADLPAVRGGRVVIADDQEPPTLNPFAPGGDNAIVQTIGQAHVAGVYDIDAVTLRLTAELVTELPSTGNGGVVLNDDGTMTVNYQIRDEAVWSDGIPVSGSDFQFTYETIMTPDLAVDKAVYEDIQSTEVGAKTFSYTLAQPTVEYELMFGSIIPKHAVEGTDLTTDWNETMWPSAGPFIVAEWQRGEYIRLVRNDNYWKIDPETGAQLPYLDEVEFRFIPETDSLVYAFTQRDIDVIQPPPSTEIISRLMELESAGAEVQVRAGPVWEHLNFQFGPSNRNPESLNAFTPFRQAVAYAIDPYVLGPLVGWIPVTSVLSPSEEDGPWAQYAVDTGKAIELLAEACDLAERDCAAEPPRLVFSTTSNADERPRIADQLKVALGRIGIEVELQLEDSQLYFGDTLDLGTWDVGWWAWVSYPGAVGFLRTLDLFDPDAPPPDGGNYYRWGTAGSSVDDEAVARFREVLAVARQAVDPQEAITLAAAAEQILADNAVVVPVAARRVVGAVWADKVAGYEMNPTRANHTWNIEFWHRLDL